MLQATPDKDKITSVVKDVNIIVNWLRTDNFTLKQLIAVRKPVT